MFVVPASEYEKDAMGLWKSVARFFPAFKLEREGERRGVARYTFTSSLKENKQECLEGI